MSKEDKRPNADAEDPEVQRLRREGSKSQYGPVPGADRDDSPEPGTEDL